MDDTQRLDFLGQHLYRLFSSDDGISGAAMVTDDDLERSFLGAINARLSPEAALRQAVDDVLTLRAERSKLCGSINGAPTP